MLSVDVAQAGVREKLRKNIQYGPVRLMEPRAWTLLAHFSSASQASVIIWYAGDLVHKAHKNLGRIN